MRDNQFAEPRAVQIRHAGKVHDHVTRAVLERARHDRSELAGLIGDRQSAVELDDGDVSFTPLFDVHARMIPGRTWRFEAQG
jgi:hypothetical protein